MPLKRQIFICVLMSAVLSSPLLSIDNAGKAFSNDFTSTATAVPQEAVEYLFLESVEGESLDSSRLNYYTSITNPHKYCCNFSTTKSSVSLVYYTKNQCIDTFKKVGQELYQLIDIPPPLM